MKHSLLVTDVTRYASVSLKPRPNYVCLQCRQLAFVPARRTRAPPPVSYIQRRFASDYNSWTEKLRRKIWGTENPPGQEDPYSYESPRDRDKKRDRPVKEPEEAPPEEPQETAPERPQKSPPRSASTAESDTGDYVPATSWDGLDHIGGQDESWKEAWDQTHPFEGFMAPTKMESREEISEAIHRALVEIFTLKEARIPIEISMGYGETAEADYFKDVSFTQAANGRTVPVFSHERLREEVLDSLTEVENDSATSPEVTVESEAPVPKEAEVIENDSPVQAETEAVVSGDMGLWDETGLEDQESTEREEPILENRSNDETWLNISFHDRKTKFAIMKRVMQLTGRRIPDPSIDEINSAKGLLGFLVKKPKPKKLAQSLMADIHLESLPNVKIMDRRYTPIDKEKQVGRWKVIEKELQRQGLPVIGGHRENAWNPAKPQ